MYQETKEEYMEEMDEVRAAKKVLMKKSPVHRQIKGIINKYVADGYNVQCLYIPMHNYILWLLCKYYSGEHLTSV